ncbi:2-succinyl-5-enolpyruvyl-6-hydroxy-3-cyclohexene-1-carboxylate synthase [Microlunatus endophyticus]|uniref:2-succinyl-5-enolpyruvyl-6-hydroxy-3-cyclohexene-1-carboxylate synthase n=1 Tax=Microlunatus endophyticus TaxID=1716077 RepID=A0A917S8M4_9ACTN|nr:2-succinyl-5-enolpyruvyl-6-hydroxy-3-cyclohexene-1-carboxylic-acid synthase [Microlunatus endophyticus]GGL63879.1 2-succinyl-5-enolpyruvyl-6-hydroxy-3-cyclohexene-1-carboxylate synthase [Microlunatus endophyticus]
MTGSTACARVVVEELISYGVRDVVLAPGSRNAPLAYELFEADKIGLLRLHIRIDERSAAFTALGLAKGSATPVPVITTSGTAAGNLHPAVMEAWHSRVPLIAITADRPLSVVNTGANQTTRQSGLFAGHVRAEVQLSSNDLAPRAWRFQLNRALVAASGLRSMIGGPVHVNIGFSEPLVPEPVDAIEEDYREVTPSTGRPPVTRLPVGPQTVVVAGDLPPEDGAEIAAIAERAGIPLLAEPSSNARGGGTAISSYRLLLQSSLVDDIERVIVVGHTTLSRPVTRLLQRQDIELIIVDAAPEWSDPAMNADRVIAAFELSPGSAESDGPDEWLARWQQADRALRPLITRTIADPATDAPMITGPALAELVWQSLGAEDLLFVGSSNPIRDLDLAGRSATPPVTYANRGLAGIDGSVSTAIGLALAADQPAHALLGDLTFLHDSNGLIIGPAEPRPRVRFIVADDNGGSIFATLEQGHPAQMSAFERLFGTPHGTDLAGIAAASGVDYLKITRLDDLREHLRLPPHGLEIIDVRVDRDHRRTLDERLNSLAATL